MKQLIIHDVRKVGEKLQHERIAQGLTQRDLHNLTGIGTTTILRAELGRGCPGLETLQIWAGALGYDVVILHCDR